VTLLDWDKNFYNVGTAAANPVAVATSPDGDWFLIALAASGISFSGDMGLNWHSAAGSGSRACKGACISTDAAQMYVVTDDGATGEIQRSTDQGANWSVVGNAARYTSICCSIDGHYVFATTQTGIEVSSDYGATFSPVTTPYRGVASFDASSADDAIQCSSATYADARSGAGTKALMGEASNVRVGQRLAAGTYYCWEGFAYWDTSSLADDLTIADAYVDLRGSSDASTTAFDIEVRACDYGATVQTSDYVAGANLGTYTLLATISSELVGTTYYHRTHPTASLKAAINKTGNTQVLLHSSRQRTSDTPGGDEYWSLYGGTSGAKLRLRVEYLTSGSFWEVDCSADGRYVYAKQGGAAPNGEYVAVSSDYGATWSHVNPDQANGADLSAVYSATAGSGGICCSSDGQRIIVGPGTHVNNRQTRLSTDGGATWANHGTMVGGNYNSSTHLACSDDGTYVVANGSGGGGVAAQNWSEDSGASYATEGYSSYTYTGVALAGDGMSGVTGPSTSSFPYTHTRTRRHSLNALKTVWACGDSGKIVKSSDGGHTWAEQTSGVATSLKGISAYDKDHALCCGLDGVILYTSDGGANWNASVDADITGTANDWYDVFMATPLVGWAASDASRIVKTTDGGATWTIQQANQSSKWLRAIDGTKDNVDVVLAGGPGWGGSGTKMALYTSNGGANWSQVAAGIGSGYGLGCVDVEDDYGVTCAQSSTGTSGFTSDGGATWASGAAGNNGTYRGCAIAQKGDGWDGRHRIIMSGFLWGIGYQDAASVAGHGTAGAANVQFAGYYTVMTVSGGTFYHSHQGGRGWEATVSVGAYTLNDVWGEEEWGAFDASVVINSGAGSTADNDVTLTLACTATYEGSAEPVDQMRFSNDGATWGDWVAYATSAPWQLAAQESYPTVERTVYAQFRFTHSGKTFTSDAVSDTINLAVVWQVDIEINGGADWTMSRDVEVVLHGDSSASDNLYNVPDEFRLRENAGSWGAWTPYVMNGGKRHGKHWCGTEYTLGGSGNRSLEVQFRDDDDNTSPLDEDSIRYITAVVPGTRYDGGPPPYDASHWQLLVGDGTADIMRYLDTPPKFGHGPHGDGYLEATIVVDDPARRTVNELQAGALVRLYDQQHRLFYGYLKPVERISEGTPAITIQATGDLDQAKQDESFVKTWVDTDPTRWFQDTKDSRAYNVDTEGRLRLEHEKGRGVTADKGCALRYWLDDGLRTTDVIDHVVFTGYDVNVDASMWYARLSTCDNPWTGHTAYKTWNNEHPSGLGSLRYPTSGSFAEDGVSGVYGLKLRLWSGNDLTAAESANDRYAIFDDVAVYVSSAAPTVDEAMGAVAEDMGWDTDLTTVGSAIADLRISDVTTRAAALDALAELYSGELEWYVSAGLFVCRAKPAAPESRKHWYVVDTRNCSFNVVADSEMRVDYVAVMYAIKGSTTYPNGTRRILWRPSAPASESDRCTVLDIQELGLKTEAQAQAAGDQYLAWNAANSISGDISGFGALLKTVDGQWVPACHARPGDWVQAVDRLDVPPQYITGVQVDAFDKVTLSLGGSEGEFRGVPRTRKRRPKFWRRRLHWRVEHNKTFI
jgi:photosystem II stability/assembly factor-like uncharacterized protein